MRASSKRLPAVSRSINKENNGPAVICDTTALSRPPERRHFPGTRPPSPAAPLHCPAPAAWSASQSGRAPTSRQRLLNIRRGAGGSSPATARRCRAVWKQVRPRLLTAAAAAGQVGRSACDPAGRGLSRWPPLVPEPVPAPAQRAPGRTISCGRCSRARGNAAQGRGCRRPPVRAVSHRWRPDSPGGQRHRRPQIGLIAAASVIEPKRGVIRRAKAS